MVSWRSDVPSPRRKAVTQSGLLHAPAQWRRGLPSRRKAVTQKSGLLHAPAQWRRVVCYHRPHVVCCTPLHSGDCSSSMAIFSIMFSDTSVPSCNAGLLPCFRRACRCRDNTNADCKQSHVTWGRRQPFSPQPRASCALPPAK